MLIHVLQLDLAFSLCLGFGPGLWTLDWAENCCRCCFGWLGCRIEVCQDNKAEKTFLNSTEASFLPIWVRDIYTGIPAVVRHPVLCGRNWCPTSATLFWFNNYLLSSLMMLCQKSMLGPSQERSPSPVAPTRTPTFRRLTATGNTQVRQLFKPKKTTVIILTICR